MKPFALLSMMWMFVSNGLTSKLILYLLLIAAGAGVRLMIKHKRDFNVVTAVSIGLWVICELVVDIGSAREISTQIFSSACMIGALSFCFAIGFLLCTFVCSALLHKQLT